MKRRKACVMEIAHVGGGLFSRCSMARISCGGTTTAAMEIPFDGEDTLEVLVGVVTPIAVEEITAPRPILTLHGRANKTNIMSS
jgi:hypothetical protein